MAERRYASKWTYVALAAIFMTTGIGNAQPFKRLSAAQIKSVIAAYIITDDAHWSDRYDADGRLIAMELGKVKHGRWRIAGNELCTLREARKPVEECFEIWAAADEIEFRRDGITVISALLRNR